MSLVFKPIKVGNLTLMNRFMRSPCSEHRADPKTGIANAKLLKYIEQLGEGKVGLIVPGYVYISQRGKAGPAQTGLHTKEQAEVWRKTIEKVHSYGSKLVFQIAHAGSCLDPVSANHEPFGVSDGALNPEARAMTLQEIEETIQEFVDSAKLAKSVNADGVQLHGAHCYLLSTFLSPLFNRRTDKYGGSHENRIRIVQEITDEIKKACGNDFPVLIKMNSNDCVEGGTTPEIASKVVHSLKGIDLFELSGGTTAMTIIRSKPVSSFYKKAKIEEINYYIDTQRSNDAHYQFEENYFLEGAKLIKKENPDKLIAVVGGIRELSQMEEIVSSGAADIVSLGRPLIREPFLIRDFINGKKTRADCISCGECILRNPSGKCYFPKV
ncbi:NADPH dehydrogenase [Tritrichomonas foetus]|uniref:NADPH dehydrogenase n=1 Tax=Tritrichomonas foetus TaxID=1144522 RepID=A0A1J4JFE8_9EUKA|nr:NADPH dehydrogenase [Tritrichomonas foetus]|eukprot:OHS97840.1 NADPH dehydrogenase [Tritrichomonas foetus]